MTEVKSRKDPAEKIRQLRRFLPAVLVYFVVTSFTIIPETKLWVVLISKIFPIVILMGFVLRQEGTNLFKLAGNTFSRRVFLGLIFSMIGDASLVYQNKSDLYFIGGIIAFGIGHLMYILAFGWRPFAPVLMFKLIIVATSVFILLWVGGLKDEAIHLKIGVGVYAALNGAMNWRSWARLSIQDFKEDRWYEFLGCIGAFFFLVSDTLLAANKFVYNGKMPYENLLIMSTYYVAQLGITLTVVDGPDTYGDDKEHDE
ncbi:lysoplasmalogenase TMEM86A-like [Clavelina lepadiformis]|uniref:lysoplasmalogenase TMEM86A-like n=1 Tax=Clavelina lepadiformis TaxID=159417 RepID=UPI0040419A6C